MNDKIHLNIKHKLSLPALFALFSTRSFSSVFSSLLNPSLAFCGDQYRGAKAAGGTENRRTSTWEMSESCCQNTEQTHTRSHYPLERHCIWQSESCGGLWRGKQARMKRCGAIYSLYTDSEWRQPNHRVSWSTVTRLSSQRSPNTCSTHHTHLKRVF